MDQHEPFSPLGNSALPRQFSQQPEQEGILLDFSFNSNEHLFRFLVLTQLLESPSEKHPAAKVVRMVGQSLATDFQSLFPKPTIAELFSQGCKGDGTGVNLQQFFVLFDDIHMPPFSQGCDPLREFSLILPRHRIK